MPWRQVKGVNALTIILILTPALCGLLAATVARQEYDETATKLRGVAERVQFAVDTQAGPAQTQPVEIPVAAPAARTIEGIGVGSALVGLLVLVVRVSPEVYRLHCGLAEKRIQGEAKDKRIAELEAARIQERKDHDRELKHARRDADHQLALIAQGWCPNSPGGHPVHCPHPPPSSDDAMPVAPPARPDDTGSDLPTIPAKPKGPSRT